MYEVGHFFNRYFGILRRKLSRFFYRFLARLDHDGEVTLMNYGYAAEDRDFVTLEKHDEEDRLCLQLYHRVTSAVELQGRDVLEVGSGRGGGASFIKRYLHPRLMVGIDYAPESVFFSGKTHNVDGLRFIHGDAERIPFGEGSFDAVVNVESSTCYGNMQRFLDEVHRVLRPEGWLLWADTRRHELVDDLYRDFEETGYRIVHKENITGGVVRSMNLLGQKNRDLVARTVPWWARATFYNFAGIPGTGNYKRLQLDKSVYLRMVLQKI